MVNSIRGRLQLWYGLILLAVLAGFGGWVYSRTRAETYSRIDRQLESAVHYLDVALRNVPPPEFLPGPPPKKGGDFDPKKGDKGDFDPKKKFKSVKDFHDRRISEIELPDSLRAADPKFPPLYLIIWKDDRVLKATPPLPPDANREIPEPGGKWEPLWLQSDGRRELAMRGPGNSCILVGKEIGPELAETGRFGWQMLAMGGGVLLVGLFGGWVLSGRVVRPIADISATASRISATHLSGRIVVKNLDAELVELATVLNAMFERLEAEFARQTRFTSDASHELRTPLAVLLANVELALSRERSPESYRDTLTTCRTAATRMRALVDGLLTLARADAQQISVDRKSIDLRGVIEEASMPFGEQASRAGVALTAHLAARPIQVLGDRVLLGRVVANLLSNALRHTPSGGRVRIAVDVEGKQARMTISDTGEGIEPEHQAKIFERFFRVDDSRARESGGYGLGLAICRTLVETHAGTISVESRRGEGSVFIVRLPLANS